MDEIAHDVVMECSNMGLCDRKTGACQCRIGYEVRQALTHDSLSDWLARLLGEA